MACVSIQKRRFLRRVIVVALCVVIIDAVWLLFIASVPENSNISVKLRSQKMFSEKTRNSVQDRCVRPNVLAFLGHSDIYTYDLPEVTDYSMYQSNKEYVIPVKSEQEAAYGPNLRDLEVIVVPFSHADPGYGNTMEGYYASSVKKTLDSMVEKLTQHTNLTFQWAETVFLARWWKDIRDDTKNKVRELIRRGQFEIVLGGWVMPDEASTHYVSVIDQLIEGHQWLIENLGVKPKNSWSNDPFGYSNTMPYLWKQTGMENMLILRIHQAIKGTLMKKRSLEFQWQQYWSNAERNSIFCNIMPYRGYWIGDVCGPYKQHICREYAFHRTEPIHKVVFVTEQNLAERARVLYEQYRVTGELYQYDTLYMGLGEDFSFNNAAEWERIYDNFNRLMNYINSKKEWRMTVRFGTLDNYFSTVKSKQAIMKQHGGTDFPTLSGDFFPYSDFQNDYWTGYYTTRPFNKRTSREVQTLIHGADIFHVYATAYMKKWNVTYSLADQVNAALQEARRDLGMFQHHDGITGTSVPHVVRDFEMRLLRAYNNAKKAYRVVVTSLLSKGQVWSENRLIDESSRSGTDSLTQKSVTDITNKATGLVVINSQERARSEVVSMHVSSSDVTVKDNKGSDIAVQIDDIRLGGRQVYRVSLQVDIPAFGIVTYSISKAESGKTVAKSKTDFSLHNEYMKAEFHPVTGMLVTMTVKGHSTFLVGTEFLAYEALRSGPYIFSPKGPANPILQNERPEISSTTGKFFSEIVVKYPGFEQRWRLYHVSGIQGQGLHLQNEIKMDNRLTNREVILRFKTETNNSNTFFTDQNGFQLMGRRHFPDRAIETNYYPITTMAILEDDQKRFTLHAQQPHGAASLKEGWLEVMLDRNVVKDDFKGLGQGVRDNKLTVSDFIIQLEYKSRPSPIEEQRYTYATLEESIMNGMLQNSLNLLLYPFPDTSVTLNPELESSFTPMTSELPCDVSVVGMRNLVKGNFQYNGTSLVLHRKSMHCGYTNGESSCEKVDASVTLETLFPGVAITKTTETTLSHLYKKGDILTGDDMTPSANEIRAFKLDI